MISSMCSVSKQDMSMQSSFGASGTEFIVVQELAGSGQLQGSAQDQGHAQKYSEIPRVFLVKSAVDDPVLRADGAIALRDT
ncbi:MAG: hypothetical protein WBA28_07170, partial [Microbacteriaceae bacterium]